MNYVYLTSQHGVSKEAYITEEVYAQIADLVQAHKQCASERMQTHPYTSDNPCVGKNICLEHLLTKQPQLTKAPLGGVTSDNRAIYYFVDKRGMVYTCTEDSDTEAKESLDETLAYYGFTSPKTITSRGKTVDFYSYYARLYGDLKTASVIVLSYNHYSEKIKGLFLLYKHGPVKELLRKSELYRNADTLVEATKDAHGEYHLNGSTHHGKYEADILDVVSQLESAVYDVTRRLQNGKQSTDNRTEGQDG